MRKFAFKLELETMARTTGAVVNSSLASEKDINVSGQEEANLIKEHIKY